MHLQTEAGSRGLFLTCYARFTHPIADKEIALPQYEMVTPHFIHEKTRIFAALRCRICAVFPIDESDSPQLRSQSVFRILGIFGGFPGLSLHGLAAVLAQVLSISVN